MDEEIRKYKNRISELIQQKAKTEIIEIQVDKPETLSKIKDLEEKLEMKTSEIISWNGFNKFCQFLFRKIIY